MYHWNVLTIECNIHLTNGVHLVATILWTILLKLVTFGLSVTMLKSLKLWYCLYVILQTKEKRYMMETYEGQLMPPVEWVKEKASNSILNRLLLYTSFHCLLSFTFVTFFIYWCLSSAASSVSWCWTCFVCSTLTYEIYTMEVVTLCIYILRESSSRNAVMLKQVPIISH